MSEVLAQSAQDTLDTNAPLERFTQKVAVRSRPPVEMRKPEWRVSSGLRAANVAYSWEKGLQKSPYNYRWWTSVLSVCN